MAISSWLYGFKIAILVASGFQDSELEGPKKALLEAGAIVYIIAPNEGKVQGWDWYVPQATSEVNVDVSLSKVDPNEYDALLIPGGVSCFDELRTDSRTNEFVKSFKDKPIASICHGPCLLIDAELIKNKTITSYPSIKVDLINAGANWVDREVVRDGLLVTSREPSDIPAFNKAMIDLFVEYYSQKKK